MLITTRSGVREPFDADKVAQTVRSLFAAQEVERYPLTMVVQRVYELLLNVDGDPTTDTVQDAIEYALLCYGEGIASSSSTTTTRRELPEIAHFAYFTSYS